MVKNALQCHGFGHCWARRGLDACTAECYRILQAVDGGHSRSRYNGEGGGAGLGVGLPVKTSG